MVFLGNVRIANGGRQQAKSVLQTRNLNQFFSPQDILNIFEVDEEQKRNALKMIQTTSKLGEKDPGCVVMVRGQMGVVRGQLGVGSSVQGGLRGWSESVSLISRD